MASLVTRPSPKTPLSPLIPPRALRLSSSLRYFQNKTNAELQQSRDASVTRELQRCWKHGGGREDGGGVTPLKVKRFRGSTPLWIAPSAARRWCSARWAPACGGQARSTRRGPRAAGLNALYCSVPEWPLLYVCVEWVFLSSFFYIFRRLAKRTREREIECVGE